MTFAPLEPVVLTHDLPAHGLKAGDLGAVVEVYEQDRVDVEFVRASGETTALVTLKVADLRPVSDRDVPTVRVFS